jgi:hypothetical protein
LSSPVEDPIDFQVSRSNVKETFITRIFSDQNLDLAINNSCLLSIWHLGGLHVLQKSLVLFVSDACSPSPCQNNGLCSRTTTSYMCECPVGYLGINCQTGKTFSVKLLNPDISLCYFKLFNDNINL